LSVPSELGRVREMAGERRASAAEHAARVNAAAQVLARRAGCSARQARRYLSQAAGSGRVAVPDEAASFTVRRSARLAAAVREHARASGRTVSSVAAQALEEFLGRGHESHPRR
jgi:response regulator RpfG family c-di-GMP phosphodiesterase